MFAPASASLLATCAKVPGPILNVADDNVALIAHLQSGVLEVAA
jgi:hypothetical protein